MIFYVLAHLLRLNFFSHWTVVNKHSFTIIIGTLLWSFLWQFTRSYTGNSIILKSIYTGFYYIVVADLYTFFMSSSSIYNDNIYNKNFHDINYYNTLEMQPIPVRKVNSKHIIESKFLPSDKKTSTIETDNDDECHVESDVVSNGSDENLEKNNEKDITQ